MPPGTLMNTFEPPNLCHSVVPNIIKIWQDMTGLKGMYQASQQYYINSVYFTPYSYKLCNQRLYHTVRSKITRYHRSDLTALVLIEENLRYLNSHRGITSHITARQLVIMRSLIGSRSKSPRKLSSDCKLCQVWMPIKRG